MASKGAMTGSLPVSDGHFTLRAWTLQDVEALAGWPSYPPAYAAFDLSYRTMTPADRKGRFESKDADTSRITLVADLPTEPVAAYVALIEIDWLAGYVGNMAVRLKPACCDRGLGTRLLRLVAQWCFDNGVSRLRLDVAAANPRAVRCYEKAGFTHSGEFWRDESRLRGVDLSQDEYALLRPHVRRENDAPQVRFYWMELSVGRPGS
jgi:RimJ/RimL family protein N-acetyltransferase